MPITAENARECQVKSLAKRAQLKQERANRRAIEALAQDLQQNGEKGFQNRTLSCVRQQITTLLTAIDEALDNRESKTAKELSDSLRGLAELERQLSGRPMPGSLRPTGRRGRSHMPDPEPVEMPGETEKPASTPAKGLVFGE